MEPTEGSETSVISNQTPGKHPKENTLHVKHGESLKSKIFAFRNFAKKPKGSFLFQKGTVQAFPMQQAVVIKQKL
jgi:hypothetical protein